jgi:membrane protease subunit HflK
MKLPFTIERVYTVSVERIFKEEFGFRTEHADVRTRYSTNDFSDESNMLTGDLNALVVTWIVQFQIVDPVKYLFRLRHAENTIRDMSEAVMRRLVGDYSVDEVLTTKRDEINTEGKKLLQEILDSYDSGIRIGTVKLQDVTPPVKVQAAFNEVNQAKQEKERVINESLQGYNKIIPQAQGGAQKAVLEAQAYAIDRVNRAKGDASRFSQVLAEYRKSPEITRRRLYLEAMQKILSRPREKYVIDAEQKNSVVPFFDMRKLEKGTAS